MFKIFGDFFGPVKENTESLKDEMIAHLEKKYGEKFLPIYLEPSGFAIEYDRLQFYKEGTDRELDKASIYRYKENDKFYFKDDYFGILIREEYENIIKNEVEKVFGTCKVFTSFYSDSFPDKLTKEHNYLDVIKLNFYIQGSFDIYIDTQENLENFQTQVDKLNLLLEKAKIRGSYSIFHMKPDHLKNISRKTYKDYIHEYTPQFYEVCFESIDVSITYKPFEIDLG